MWATDLWSWSNSWGVTQNDSDETLGGWKHHHINCKKLENDKLLAGDGDGREGLIDNGSLHLCFFVSCKLWLMVLLWWFLVLMAIGVWSCLIIYFSCVWAIFVLWFGGCERWNRLDQYIWKGYMSFGQT
jgi:hypothetical protein